MQALAVVFVIALFALIVLCIAKEPKLSGFYSSIGVCGRGSAFFTMYALFLGVGCTVALPILLIIQLSGGFVTPFAYYAALVICAVLGWLVGLLMYRKISGKCPACLRKHLFWDMVVIAVGIQWRVSLFFMMFIVSVWWEMNRPTAYEVDGKTVYAYPGENTLYDSSGNRVGTTDPDRKTARLD